MEAWGCHSLNLSLQHWSDRHDNGVVVNLCSYEILGWGYLEFAQNSPFLFCLFLLLFLCSHQTWYNMTTVNMASSFIFPFLLIHVSWRQLIRTGTSEQNDQFTWLKIHHWKQVMHSFKAQYTFLRLITKLRIGWILRLTLSKGRQSPSHVLLCYSCHFLQNYLMFF